MHSAKSRVKLKEIRRKSFFEVSQTKGFLELRLGSKSKYRVWREGDRTRVKDGKRR